MALNLGVHYSGAKPAADVAIGSFLYWGFNLVPILPKLEALVDYWNRLAQRPAWKAANEAADA